MSHLPQSDVQTSFQGPLFIVGMPRSGTKLMRALLNQHPRISLTLAESHFIPYFIKKFGTPPPFEDPDKLQRFVETFIQTSFFRTMQRAGYEFNRQEFMRQAPRASWSTIFEYLLRQFGAKRARQDMIWGDKTPGYIRHMALLKALFPGAKFLHMIRDPRDYCLSVQKSWGKSLSRAALRWRDTVAQARTYGQSIPGDYLEIQYETLLADPASVLQQATTFLVCPYDPRMLHLETSQEDVGDAKGKHGIVRDNTHKYRTQLSPQNIQRIEAIVGPVAVAANYVLAHKGPPIPLHPLNIAALKLYDGMASFKYHATREQGLVKGLQAFINHYTKSSWR
jgi:sulfotransferase family protein